MPFGLSSGRDNSFSGMGLDRADVSGNPALDSDRPLAAQLARYFDVTKASVNAVGTFGTAPRNFLRGMGSFSIDSAIQKELSAARAAATSASRRILQYSEPPQLRPAGDLRQLDLEFRRHQRSGRPRILQIGARLAF